METIKSISFHAIVGICLFTTAKLEAALPTHPTDGADRSMTAHLHLVQRLRIRGAKQPILRYVLVTCCLVMD